VPINASDLQIRSISMRSKAARASAMADWHWPTFLPDLSASHSEKFQCSVKQELEEI
jgi:hypothetical protein